MGMSFKVQVYTVRPLLYAYKDKKWWCYALVYILKPAAMFQNIPNQHMLFFLMGFGHNQHMFWTGHKGIKKVVVWYNRWGLTWFRSSMYLCQDCDDFNHTETFMSPGEKKYNSAFSLTPLWHRKRWVVCFFFLSVKHTVYVQFETLVPSCGMVLAA